MKSLAELIFPSRCIGCSQLGISICSICRKNWHPHIYHRTLNVLGGSYPVISAIEYSPIAGKVLLAAKENGLVQADELMIDALKKSLSYCVKEQGIGMLIPIPSRPSIARLRGRQFMCDLSEQLSKSCGLPTFENLIHVRKVRDQSALDARARVENLAGALKGLRYLSGKAFLIDDLVTTGATLHEVARALRELGIEVAAGVTACVAEPLR